MPVWTLRSLFICAFFSVVSPLGAAALFNLTLPWNDASDNALSVQAQQPERAGAHGFVTVNGAGHLATTLGRQRFWGTNTTFGANFPTYSDAAQVAARLGKFGFNIIRFHHMDSTLATNGIWDSVTPDRNLDGTQLDRMDYFIDQLAQHGIYADLNLVVSRPFHPGSELDPSLIGISDVKVRAALGFFDPANLALQKQYASALLNHFNPYTGHAYKDEPAVAFVEINNENGLVQAWMSQQLDSLPTYYADLLKLQWDQWLTAKYGNQATLLSAWNVTNTPLGAEMLANGSFPSSLAGWNVEQHAPAVVAGAVTPDGAGATNVARITVSTVGTLSWHAQFNQGNLNVTAGSPYTLGFWAKADGNKTLTVDLGQNHGAYSGLGFNANLPLTTTWQYFEYVLVPNASDTNARLNFSNMGIQTGQFYFGNVSLRPGGTVGLYPGEDLSTNSIRGFLEAGESIARTTEAKKDWLRFLLATEDAYWTAMRNHVKSIIGSQSLVFGTVQGCSTPNLQAPFDVIDTHYYWRHPQFPSTPWDPVDWYVGNDAMVDDPTNSSPAALGMQAVLGKPHAVTELNAPFPNTHEADLFLITAAYAGLQDFDAVFPFDYWGSNATWAYTGVDNFFDVGPNPLKMAGMPAASLAFRRGDFSPANQTVAVPMLREDEVTQLGTSFAWRLVNANTAGEDPRTALIHQVRQVVEGQSAPGGSLAPGTTSVGATVLTSDTGQLRWDSTQATKGLVTGDSPRSQFAAGFFNGRSVALTGLTFSAVDSIQVGEYAVCALSSLDNLDLSVTASALLTVLGTQRNTGSTCYQYPSTVISFPPAKGIQLTLKNLWGSGPAQVEGVSVTVTLAYAASDVQVWALSNTGARNLSVPVLNAGGLAQVILGPAYQALNYEVVVSRPAYSPTATRTVTPVQTPTVTRTPSPVPTPPSSILWEDFETADTPANWQAFIDTSTGTVLGLGLSTGTANVGEGIYAGDLRFNSGSAGNWGGGFLVNSPYGTKPSLGYRDLTGMQALQVMLWTDKSGLKVRPTLSEAGNTTTAVAGGDGEVWESSNGAWTVLPANTWVLLTYPLAAFRDKPNYPYNPTSLGNNTMDLSAISWITLEWDGNQGANVRLRMDYARFCSSIPTPTPTATRTVTPSPSPSPSISPSQTLSFTPSLSPSITPTPSASPVVSSTFTVTASPSMTSINSLTSTFTATAVAPLGSATPSPASDPGGELKVLSSAPVPQPQSGAGLSLAVNLLGGAQSLRVKVYSSSFTLLGSAESPGPFAAGWSSAFFPGLDLASGLYFYVVEAQRGGKNVRATPQRLVVLR